MVSRLEWNKWINNHILLQQDKIEQDCTAQSKVPNVVELKKENSASFTKRQLRSHGHMLPVSALSRELLHHVQVCGVCSKRHFACTQK